MNRKKTDIKKSIDKRAYACNEGLRNYKFCLEEKYHMIIFLDLKNLLNKRHKLVAKSHHES